MADEQVKRLYSGIADTKMFNRAQGIKNLLQDDIGAFGAKDAEFNAIFLSNFQTEIDNCTGFTTDETHMDQVEELTRQMNVAWKDCREYFQDMKYYIEKAFPIQPGIQNKFGVDNYRNMSREQYRVVSFMDNLEEAADTYTTELIAAGMTAAQIGQIPLLRDAFKAANGAQEKALDYRLELTRLRIEQNNKLWAILQQVNKLSKAVYRGVYSKLQQYLLPAPATNEPESLALTGTVLNAADDAPIEDAVVELPALLLSTTTDETGKYGFTQSIPDGPTTLRVSAPGFVTSEVSVTIVDGTLVERNVRLTGV